MKLDLDTLRRRFQGNYGTAPKMRCWYRSTYRDLRRIGFVSLGRGTFINGKFRAVVKFRPDSSDGITALITIMGPPSPKKPVNLYDMPHLKFLTLNAAGKICKIPAKNWDRKRKSRSLSEL